jgi:hypothetical protein
MPAAGRQASEGVNESGVPEQTAQTRPIKAECRGSNGACAPLDGTKKASLSWPAPCKGKAQT